jgi:hypothetical protein
MIFPVAHTLIQKETIDAIAHAAGIRSPIQRSDRLTPALLARSLALRHSTDDCYELGHFTLSFYVETDQVMTLIGLSTLRVLTIREGCYILTTDILGWRDLIVKGLTKQQSTEVRRVLNVILAYLRDNGFSDLFSEYKRLNLVLDKTLYLEKQ